MNKGKAIIFSAPSGSGKTTIVRHLLKTCDYLAFSISATTRRRREDRELNGKDYYFLSMEDFSNRISNGEFIEWEEVYNGNYYGTLKSEIERIWSQGKHVVFDVDVKGGIQLKKYFKDTALALFVKVKSLDVLENRLRHRNTETEENIINRLSKSEYELSFENEFDKTIISDKLDHTLKEAQQIVEEFIFSKRG